MNVALSPYSTIFRKINATCSGQKCVPVIRPNYKNTNGYMFYNCISGFRSQLIYIYTHTHTHTHIHIHIYIVQKIYNACNVKSQVYKTLRSNKYNNMTYVISYEFLGSDTYTLQSDHCSVEKERMH
jgi:hypothetical protein